MPEPVDPSPVQVSRGDTTETQRASPPALEADTPRLVVIGIGLWLAALVVGLVVDRGNSDWLWTCVAGMVLGAGGLVLARRARRGR